MEKENNEKLDERQENKIKELEGKLNKNKESFTWLAILLGALASGLYYGGTLYESAGMQWLSIVCIIGIFVCMAKSAK
jgi:hypothetical protein